MGGSGFTGASAHLETTAVTTSDQGEAIEILATCDSKNACDIDVTEILVGSGDTVEAGQLLMTLEFYKVVTEVMAPAAGVVTAIHVERKAEVQVGDPLITFVPESATQAAATATK
jgi:pyruvate carboxylase subunit B